MMIRLTDSHCHLELADFSQRDESGAIHDERAEVIARARAASVSELICIGSGQGLGEVRNAVAIAEADDRIWAAIGIHPHDVARAPSGALDEIERLAASHRKVVAVGETGLDYHYDHSPRETQREALRAFLGIARRAQKPVSLHIRGRSRDTTFGLATPSGSATPESAAEPRPAARSHPSAQGGLDAHADAQTILGEERAGDFGGVVHCFTGSAADADRYLELGLHVSFSGVVTFKNAGEIREAARRVPLDRLLIETDCPYLAPVPLRGKRNEPAYLVHTARVVAEVRGIALSALAEATVENARRLFRLA
jgi:TatD DNase family protein